MADSDSDDSFKSFVEPETQTQPDRGRRSTTQRGNDIEPSIPTAKKPLAPGKLERLPPEEEAALLASVNSIKGRGNTLFGSGSYENAIQTYDRAVAECPNYLDFELAVLRSNVAACHIKLEEWKEATESAEKGIECLERLEPLPTPPPKPKDKSAGPDTQPGADDGIEEVDDAVADRIQNLQQSGHTLDEVRKLQIKLLLRRAKARSALDTWASLQGADEDYRVLLSPTMQSSLSPSDLRSVRDAVGKLAPRLNVAKEKEMGEMMDKLKGLGNSILSPFGLSTENFQFVKDEKSGGYSMNFNQQPAGKK